VLGHILNVQLLLVLVTNPFYTLKVISLEKSIYSNDDFSNVISIPFSITHLLCVVISHYCAKLIVAVTRLYTLTPTNIIPIGFCNTYMRYSQQVLRHFCFPDMIPNSVKKENVLNPITSVTYESAKRSPNPLKF